MALIAFGVILLFMGWNWLVRRFWWADQAWKSPLAPPCSKNVFACMVGGLGVVTIIVGLYFVIAGIILLVTGIYILPTVPKGD